MSMLGELRNKLSSGSFSLRSSTQKDVRLSPDDEAMDDRLKAIVKAFKLRTLAELKVLLLADCNTSNIVLESTVAIELNASWCTGHSQCLDLVRMRVQAGGHW